MRRTELHQLLADEAQRQGVDLLWGCAVTGISNRHVEIRGRRMPAGWIIGADGINSRVRKWAGLQASWRNSSRFAFRRHYAVAPWTDCVEIHWGPGCQIYITPIAASQTCVALISRDPHLRLDSALNRFPGLRERLAGATVLSTERGSLVATRRLRRVYSRNVVLIGDACGSVDAISGQGLGLAFAQAEALAEAIATGDLPGYQTAVGRMWRRPAFMADLMLTLGESRWLRTRAMRVLAANPHLFTRMLAMHVGELNPARFALAGVSLGARMLVS